MDNEDTGPQDPGLDIDQIHRLAALMCSEKEIAEYMGTTLDIIEEFYTSAVRRGREKGRINIRTWQMTEAQKGNIEMLKWLGLQYLSQTPPGK